MARDWVVVLDMVSPAAARSLGKGLRGEGLDVDIDARQARIWCFADDEEGALAAQDLALRSAESASEPTLQVAPMVRVWNERHRRYVDPERPDEDPDTSEVWIDCTIAPDEVTWQVRLTLESVFDFRRVRRELPRLERPVITTGNQHIDIGARDRDDANETASLASSIKGVRSVEPSEIRGRVRRWLVRQRLSGNYAVEDDGSGLGYGYADFGGGGGGGSDGGGGGHGGHGGGGHAGH